MTVSIFTSLAVTPSGARFDPINALDLSLYLKDHCDRPCDRDRERRHATRDAMYRDGGCEEMCRIIDDVFDDATIAEKRKKWVHHARYNNPLKRTVNELSTVYQRPAARVLKDETSNARYRYLMAALRQDEVFLHANRMLTLHRTILIGMRVQPRADDTKEPVLDVVTPSTFRVILDPNGLVVGYLIRRDYRKAGVTYTGPAPAWVLWTDHERALLDSTFSIIEGSYVEHGFGVNPYTPVTMMPPEPGFWPGEDGEDLVAARVAVWVTDIFMMKETKSATKMPVIAGDISGSARNQMVDSEAFLEVNEGAALSQMDNSMDLGAFQAVSKHIVSSAGQNYGLTPTMLENAGVQSADARDVMRIPLNELRDQQKLPWRYAERRIVRAQAAVCARELPEYAFNADGWSINFSEGATKPSEADDLTLFERRKKHGLDNAEDYLMRRDPDLTREDAREIIADNIEICTELQVLMRPMNAVSGADLGGDPSAAMTAVASEAMSAGGHESVEVGDRVVVVAGKEHMPEHAGVTGTVKIAQGEAIGVLFDGTKTVHRWYSPDELQPATGTH